MIPNNNLSVLPWYKDISEQDARRWWMYGKVYPLYAPTGRLLPFQILTNDNPGSVTRFSIYTKNGVFVKHLTADIRDKITIKQIGDYYAIVYPADLYIDFGLNIGQYYAVLATSTAGLWYSEIFTVVKDMSPYLKLEWWDKEDLITDAGTIVYTAPNYKNVLYLCSDIAKPEYNFEEEGETRDGYFFPTKQISEKVYHFSFLASEYLLDVIRLVRMADFARITKNGKVYNLDTFLITPEWENNGDVAIVDAEFETATVVKKNGRGYITIEQTGDFNNDFNNDFNINQDGRV